jgi:antitoxin component YwqK of YwqJK toxin-antitoxin module
MLQRLIPLITILLIGCNTKFIKTIETYSNNKVKKGYVYPNKENLKQYTIKEYFENSKPKFVGLVENDKLVGKATSFMIMEQ